MVIQQNIYEIRISSKSYPCVLAGEARSMCASITFNEEGRRLRAGLCNIGMWVHPVLVKRIDLAKRGIDLSRQKFLEKIITERITEIERTENDNVGLGAKVSSPAQPTTNNRPNNSTATPSHPDQQTKEEGSPA